MSRPKETCFFFEDCEKGIDWFSNECFLHYDGEHAVGEASAGNGMHRKVTPRIASHCPEAHLVFVLCDPVERIWSTTLLIPMWGPSRPLRDCLADQVIRRSIRRAIAARSMASDVSGWYS
jgi:hypothetical protein